MNARTGKTLKTRSAQLPLTVTAVLLVLATYAVRLPLLRVREFDPDELEHLHGAWCIAKGLLPFRDYFEAHTPLLHFFMSAFIPYFHVDTNVHDAIRFLFFARMWMWVLTGMILMAVFWLGKLRRDWKVGVIATLFIGNTLMFLEKSLELRPDVPALLCWLLALGLAIAAIRSENTASWKTRLQFALSGLLLGVGVMCTEKVLLVLPGFAAGMLWYLVDRRHGTCLRKRFVNLFFPLLGFSVPVVGVMLYFWVNHGLEQLVYYNFLLPLRWKAPYTPTNYFHRLVRQNPLLLAMAIVGTARAIFWMFRTDRSRRGDYVLVLGLLCVLGTFFLMPFPNRQFFLLFLPLGAVLAAECFVDAVESVAGLLSQYRAEKRLPAPSLESVLSGLVFLLALLVTLRSAKPYAPYYGLWLVSTASFFFLAFVQRRYWGVAILIVALSIYPFAQMKKSFAQKNTDTLKGVSYVIENTKPDETCMDGWTGFGVFRPHAWYYFFPQSDVVAIMKPNDIPNFLGELRLGKAAPTLIMFDDVIRRLSPELVTFIEEHYEPTKVEPIWRRK